MAATGRWWMEEPLRSGGQGLRLRHGQVGCWADPGARLRLFLRLRPVGRIVIWMRAGDGLNIRVPCEPACHNLKLLGFV